MSEITSVRLCGLLFWYTGGFPARTTCPPVKVTTSPLLSLNLLPRGAGPLPGAIMAAIAGGLGLITLPHLDFLAASPLFFMVSQITGKMFDPNRERFCFRSIQSGKLPDRSDPASCRTGKCCNSKFSCISSSHHFKRSWTNEKLQHIENLSYCKTASISH